MTIESDRREFTEKFLHFFPYPTYRLGNLLFSFSNAIGLTGVNRSPTGGKPFSLPSNLWGNPPQWTTLKRGQVGTVVRQLIRQGWDKHVEGRGLPSFDLSSGKRTCWFPKDKVPGDTVTYTGVNGKQSRRDLCGYKTISRITGDKFQRFWHFGLEAFPILYPLPVLALKSHVVFSLDGNAVSGDAKAQHRARRSQCKDWWNDKWRDLTLAAVEWISAGEKQIVLPLSPSSTLVMDRKPLTYQSDCGYRDAAVREPPKELDQLDEHQGGEDGDPDED